MHDERPIEIRLRAARARRRRLHAQARAFASRDALRELLQLAADIAARPCSRGQAVSHTIETLIADIRAGDLPALEHAVVEARRRGDLVGLDRIEAVAQDQCLALWAAGRDAEWLSWSVATMQARHARLMLARWVPGGRRWHHVDDCGDLSLCGAWVGGWTKGEVNPPAEDRCRTCCRVLAARTRSTAR